MALVNFSLPAARISSGDGCGDGEEGGSYWSCSAFRGWANSNPIVSLALEWPDLVIPLMPAAAMAGKSSFAAVASAANSSSLQSPATRPARPSAALVRRLGSTRGDWISCTSCLRASGDESPDLSVFRTVSSSFIVSVGRVEASSALGAGGDFMVGLGFGMDDAVRATVRAGLVFAEAEAEAIAEAETEAESSLAVDESLVRSHPPMWQHSNKKASATGTRQGSVKISLMEPLIFSGLLLCGGGECKFRSIHPNRVYIIYTCALVCN